MVSADTIERDDILQAELLESEGPKGAPQGDPIMQVRDLKVSFATEAGVCRPFEASHSICGEGARWAS